MRMFWTMKQISHVLGNGLIEQNRYTGVPGSPQILDRARSDSRRKDQDMKNMCCAYVLMCLSVENKPSCTTHTEGSHRSQLAPLSFIMLPTLSTGYTVGSISMGPKGVPVSLQYLLELIFQEAKVPTSTGQAHMPSWDCLKVLDQTFHALEAQGLATLNIREPDLC